MPEQSKNSLIVPLWSPCRAPREPLQSASDYHDIGSKAEAGDPKRFLKMHAAKDSPNSKTPSAMAPMMPRFASHPRSLNVCQAFCVFVRTFMFLVLWFIICLKWQIKAWGWIPIFVRRFLEPSTFSTNLHLSTFYLLPKHFLKAFFQNICVLNI